MEYNSHRALTNTAWSVLSYGWPILFSIIITPIVVTSLGIKEYGIYTFFNTVISLLGLLDFGISTAISKYLSEYYAQKNEEKIRKLLGTALTIFTGVGVTGLIVFGLGAIVPSFSSSLVDYSHYTLGIIFAGLTFFLMVSTSIYSITFAALQRFDISSKIGIVILTVQQISILVLVLMGYSINEIFVLQFFISLASFLTQRHLARKILPELPRKFLWDKVEAVKCYKFGVTTFINNIATTSLTYLDRLIIPFFLGPSSLTYYSLPGNITNRIPSLSNSLSVILFPMASGLHGMGDMDKIRNLYIRSFRLITVIAAAMTVTTLAYAHQILQYWISAEFADKATMVLIILAFTNFVLALASPLSNFLLGLGKLKFITTLSITMAVVNTILLVILIPLAGINGAAWAYLLSLFPVLYMIYFTEKHYLSLTERKKYYIKTILGNLLVGVIIYMIGKLFLVNLISSLLLVLIVGGVTMIAYIALYWAFRLFEREDIESVKLFARRIIKKT